MATVVVSYMDKWYKGIDIIIRVFLMQFSK